MKENYNNYIDPASFIELDKNTNYPEEHSIDRAYNPNEHKVQTAKIGHGPFHFNIQPEVNLYVSESEDTSALGSV